jgi:MFS family permease
MPRTSHVAFTFFILVAINTMNFFDRQVLPAVQEKIRAEWPLSDTQLGLLGSAFIVLYAIVGVPLGRLADRWNRRRLLACGVALWSVTTFASGFAWGFWSLFVLRLCVGIGEATCAPTASSLIGDLVPARRRSLAMSIFMLGLPIGLALSLVVSAVVADKYGWRTAFFVAGIPGLLLAVAVLFVVDPPRGGAESVAGGETRFPSFLATARRVLAMPTMWLIILSGALHNFNMYALGAFVASFIRRYHGVSVTEAGIVSGLVYGCGAFGLFAAGWLGDRVFRRGPQWRLHVAWMGLALAIPCLLFALEAAPGRLWLCVAGLLPGCLLLYAYYGTVYATIQDITEPASRGVAMALYFCAMYLLGGVLGPFATGLVSDYFAHQTALAEGAEKPTEWHKAVGLHHAMYLVPILDAALVVVLFAAARTVRRDYLKANQPTGA